MKKKQKLKRMRRFGNKAKPASIIQWGEYYARCDWSVKKKQSDKRHMDDVTGNFQPRPQGAFLTSKAREKRPRDEVGETFPLFCSTCSLQVI